MKENIFSYTLEELTECLEKYFPESRKFHAKEIFKWVYGRKVYNFEEMTNISKSLRASLAETFSFESSTLEKVEVDSVDNTKKFLIRLKDGLSVESVIIPSDKRLTLCVSCQVGCKMGCSFCLTGKMKFVRNLTAAEIIDQLRFAEEIAKQDIEALKKGEHVITNIVFMGMGEPLDNIEEVGKAINIMEEQIAFGFSKRRITVSTCGIVDKIMVIPSWGRPQLAISLHAANDDLRAKLMPINRKYPLKDLFEILKKYPLEHGRRITFEYVLIEGVNDSLDHARELVKLIRQVPSKVNLLMFNEFEGALYKQPSRSVAKEFQEFLVRSGFQTNLRESKGGEISAACGQLATQN